MKYAKNLSNTFQQHEKCSRNFDAKMLTKPIYFWHELLCTSLRKQKTSRYTQASDK